MVNRLAKLRKGLLGLVGAFALLSGCGGGGNGDSKPLEQPPAPIAAERLFPLADGHTWTYKRTTILGGGSPDVEKQQFVVSSATMPDGMPGFEIVDPSRGMLNAIVMKNAARNDGVVSFTGFLGAYKNQFTPPFPMLPPTLSSGAEWTWSGTITGKQAASGTIKSKFEGLEEIKVPAGTFKCVRISRNLDDKIKIRHWYREGVGLVKMRMTKAAAGGLPAAEDTYELESYSAR